MKKCLIIVVEEPISSTTLMIQENDSSTETIIKCQEPRRHSQSLIHKGSKRESKCPSSPGRNALSIKLNELRRSSNYSQTIDLRRSNHYVQVSRSRRSSQCQPLHGSTRSLHYSKSIGSRRTALYTHSAAPRRSSHHPHLMESRIFSEVSESSPKLLNRESSHIGSNIRTRRDTLVPPPKLKKKETQDKKCSEAHVLPMAGALLIASCLGGPVIFVAGLKLGMFAAIGGGIMGYTTGKMLEKHGLVYIS